MSPRQRELREAAQAARARADAELAEAIADACLCVGGGPEPRHDHISEECPGAGPYCEACAHNERIGLYPDGTPREEGDQ